MKRRLLLSLALVLSLGALLGAEAFKVETVKDEKGWRLLVDGKDFQVKGVVWSFTPIGENYSYDLFTRPEDYIRRTIDTDMTLLKRMGATAIRCFSTIPPQWIEYIWTRYGIATIVNDLFGRYGVTVKGVWHPHTDYSDPDTRAFLLAQARKTYETYKDTRGVLFFMLGNESNYGLEWSSNAIENLPGGQRMDAKARYLYSLFGEALKLGKTLDPDHPMGLVNGDLGYLDQIAELCPDLDILGVNTYRGRKAYNAFYASVEEVLDRPLVFTEFGADAFNVATSLEDQYHQAEFIGAQWEELYGQAYGKGKSANVLGGFVFEWMDEWWKHGMETGLSTHDTAGTWSNGAYDFDATAGRLNMNEEWFGIVGQGELDSAGVHRRVPRAAYYLLKGIWALDLYRSSAKQVKEGFASLSLAEALALATPDSLANRLDEASPLSLRGSLDSRAFASGDAALFGGGFEALKEGLEFRHVEGASLELAFRPSEELSAGLTAKFSTASRYFDAAGQPLTWFAAPSAFTWEKAEEAPVALYAAWATWNGPLFRADFLYRTGHPDWQLSGDWFGFLPEAYDRYGLDLNKEKAPFGVELAWKGGLEGLTFYAGPELYAEAYPMALAKYWRSFGHLSFGAIHLEELAYPDGSTATPEQRAEWRKTPLSRRTSLAFQADFLPAIKAQLGLMVGSPERIGETFTNALEKDGTWEVYQNRPATLLDALGARLRLTTDAIPYLTLAYLQGLYMGPLAKGEPTLQRAGSLFADPGTGNRVDAEAGFTFLYGSLALAPRFLYRRPVYGALPSLPLYGLAPRVYTDLFSVFRNREVLRGEAVVTWDPTGATWFHDWNNDDREDSELAASLSFLYDFYLGPTDRGHFIVDAAGTVASFPEGLPAISGTWALTARLVARPLPWLRLVATADAGRAQSGGDPTKAPTLYSGGTLRLALDRLLLSGELHHDSWGPEPWYREFQSTFPWQAKLGLAWCFTAPSLMTQDNRLGLDLLYRSYGADSPADQSGNGSMDARFGIQAYFNATL